MFINATYTIFNENISSMLLGEWSLFLGRKTNERGKKSFSLELNPYKTQKNNNPSKLSSLESKMN
jgi:hypothetical protein